MQTGATANFGSLENRTEKRIEETETKSSDKIIELRRKIRSGFYESKDVLMQIVAKLVHDIKQPID